MAVPKYKKSKARTMMRRSHNDKRTLIQGSICPECGELKRPHRVCPSCGVYKGQTVIKKDN
ncbi:50S ribosomal protein L32 [Spirochaetota bacterium]|nr:50S ribosomal protein L32 [Spirochaetota bacterium]